MPYAVDFTTVSTVGLESSPVAAVLAGLRANEARYFKNKYDHIFTVEPASDAKKTIDWVHRILKEERDIVISSRPLEATAFQVENIRMAYVFYESGLSINVMYAVDAAGKRAVGFKLSDGMEIPAELASRFKFARQKSKLAGTIRGSFFVIKNEYLTMHEHEDAAALSDAAAQAAQWDARYREGDGTMWSGRPNGRLVAEAGDLTPGRALDVACGEGADAVWLAERGWTVTAIDISDVAIGRARQAAERGGTAVEWLSGDALAAPFPAGSFDLVSMQYPALPKAAGEAAVRRLLDTVRPGGLLLAVFHDLDDEHRHHMKSRGFDPADYVGADDLGRLLADDFTVELHAVEPRIDPPPGNPHIADIVLRARRR